MGMTFKSPLSRLAMFMLCAVSLLSLALIPFPGDRDEPKPKPKPFSPVQLEIKPLQQKKITSCGEASITMAYNYAYPSAPLNELAIVAFAMDKGYYTDDRRPYTSPGNMILIAQNYAAKVDTGMVMTPDEGLKLLFRKLHRNDPVIIDIWTYLDVPYSDAHFVLVTGISPHPKDDGAFIIHYNNPLTARSETARWDIIWTAWQNNGDPGGSGWWMTIPTND
jgi:hypothetical protein